MPLYHLLPADHQAVDVAEGALPIPAAHPKLLVAVAAPLKKRFLYLSKLVFKPFSTFQIEKNHNKSKKSCILIKGSFHYTLNVQNLFVAKPLYHRKCPSVCKSATFWEGDMISLAVFKHIRLKFYKDS